jgi:hypothetical protein
MLKKEKPSRGRKDYHCFANTLGKMDTISMRDISFDNCDFMVKLPPLGKTFFTSWLNFHFFIKTLVYKTSLMRS